MIVTSTEAGLPARTHDGSLVSSTATVNVSSSASVSRTATIGVDPVVEEKRIRTSPAPRKSNCSDVTCLYTSGTLRMRDGGVGSDSVAVSRASEPSRTGFGATESVTVGDALVVRDTDLH